MYEDRLGEGFGLLYGSPFVKSDNFVDLETDDDPTSPTFNLAKPTTGWFVGYTIGGISIPPNAQYEFESRAGRKTPVGVKVKSVQVQLETKIVFNRDPATEAQFRLGGANYGDEFYIGSGAALTEQSFLLIEYNRKQPDVLRLFLFFRAFIEAAAMVISVQHQPIDCKINVLAAKDPTDPACFRNRKMDIAHGWYANSFTLARSDSKGVPIVVQSGGPVIPTIPTQLIQL